MRQKGEQHPLRLLVLISQIGITMMTPIFFCAWIGSWVCQKTGIDILFVLFLFIGILAGFRSSYHIIRRFVSLKSNPDAVNYHRTPQAEEGTITGEQADDPWDR